MEISNIELAVLQTMQSVETMLCYTKQELEILAHFSAFPKLQALNSFIDDARKEIKEEACKLIEEKAVWKK